MLSYLPTYYENATFVRDYLQSVGSEFDSYRAAIDQILKEFYVDTASERGLARWEFELGIPDGTGVPIDQRRERLKAKLRGYGTANMAKVKEVAEAFVYGDVAVWDESNDATLPNYTIRIEFVSVFGIPANIVEVENAVRAVVPAHLVITYQYNYTTWNEIDVIAAGAPRTWDQWDTADAGGPYTWDEMEVLA